MEIYNYYFDFHKSSYNYIVIARVHSVYTKREYISNSLLYLLLCVYNNIDIATKVSPRVVTLYVL